MDSRSNRLRLSIWLRKMSPCPWNSAAGRVEFQLTPHALDGLSEGGHIAARIVAAALERRHLCAGEDGVESVARSARRAEEPLREVDRINQCDRPGGESLLFARRGQKLRVEPVAVVRDQHGIADEVGECSQGVGDRWCAGDVAVGYAGESGDEVGDGRFRSDKRREHLVGDGPSVPEAGGSDLDDLVETGGESGRFQIKNYEITIILKSAVETRF